MIQIGYFSNIFNTFKIAFIIASLSYGFYLFWNNVRDGVRFENDWDPQIKGHQFEDIFVNG